MIKGFHLIIKETTEFNYVDDMLLCQLIDE